MSSYFVACCHPKGEADDYDGLFFRDCEFDGLAKTLVGKPLLFNHEESLPLGKVLTAWTDKPNKKPDSKRQVFALCEIDDSSLSGKLAKRGIDKQVLQDVSIGHTYKLTQWRDSRQITEKTPFELSVCKEGARNDTHIYAVSWAPEPEPSSTYIKATASADSGNSSYQNLSTMSAQTEVPTPAEKTQEPACVETTTPAPAEVSSTSSAPETKADPPVQLTHSVLAQLKKLQAENTRLAADLSSYQETNRKIREAEMNGGVKDYIEKLIAENPELGNHRTELEALMSKMVDSETAGPLVKLLKCAASKSTNSITELEKQYQMQKAKDKRIAELKAELETLKSDAFSLPEDRVGPIKVGASAELESSAKRARTGVREPKSIFDEIGEALRNSGGNGVPTLRAEEFHMSRPTSVREEFL